MAFPTRTPLLIMLLASAAVLFGCTAVGSARTNGSIQPTTRAIDAALIPTATLTTATPLPTVTPDTADGYRCESRRTLNESQAFTGGFSEEEYVNIASPYGERIDEEWTDQNANGTRVTSTLHSIDTGEFRFDRITNSSRFTPSQFPGCDWVRTGPTKNPNNPLVQQEWNVSRQYAMNTLHLILTNTTYNDPHFNATNCRAAPIPREWVTPTGVVCDVNAKHLVNATDLNGLYAQ